VILVSRTARESGRTLNPGRSQTRLVNPTLMWEATARKVYIRSDHSLRASRLFRLSVNSYKDYQKRYWSRRRYIICERHLHTLISCSSLYLKLNMKFSKLKRLLTLPVLLITLLAGNPVSSADYQKGLNAVQRGDFQTALDEWKALAEQGRADAQSGLGVLYSKGQGVPQDHSIAFEWFTRAAEQGYVTAQLNLGQMYDQGRGVQQDYKIAVKWYTLAAKLGFAPAQFNLGQMYEDGLGVTQNLKTAIKWYAHAAEQGDVRAQSDLGRMYLSRKGVSKNYVLAYMWFNIAASRGDNIARINRDKIAKKISQTQLRNAQRLARECIQKNYKGC
jgi:uncharacterized protein